MTTAARSSSTTPTRPLHDEPNYTNITHDQSPSEAISAYFKAYARERPEVVAMWAFGVGFVLGWKLRIF